MGEGVLEPARALAADGWALAGAWLSSPPAWSQLALLVAAWLLAVLASRALRPRIAGLLTPPETAEGPIARARRFAPAFLPPLLPLLACGFTAPGEQVTRSPFGSGELIAFGKRVFLLIAARILVREVLTDGVLRFPGRRVVVPKDHFITTRLVDCSDSGSAKRLEAPSRVSDDTDINRIPAIIEAAVATHPGVLTDPAPDCELRAFGESSVDFAVEFRVRGLDHGPNKCTFDVLFLIRNACKDNGIEMPFPHRVVELRGAAAA